MHREIGRNLVRSLEGLAEMRRPGGRMWVCRRARARMTTSARRAQESCAFKKRGWHARACVGVSSLAANDGANE